MICPPLNLLELFAECDRCGWQIQVFDEAERDRRQAVHAHAAHGQPLPEQPVSGATWQEQAMNAVRTVAARGKTFRIYEALAEFGLQSPPDHQHRIGRFTVLVHDLGVAHKVADGPSSRGQTKGSAAGIWHRDPARCTDPKCRATAGA